MKEILALDKLSENVFLNLLVKFFYYAMFILIALSTIWAINVRGEGQGIFVLIPLFLFGLTISPATLLMRIFLSFKKKETGNLFKSVSNKIICLPWLASLILLSVVS